MISKKRQFQYFSISPFNNPIESRKNTPIMTIILIFAEFNLKIQCIIGNCFPVSKENWNFNWDFYPVHFSGELFLRVSYYDTQNKKFEKGFYFCINEK